jgi:hypothetical protein
MQIQGYYKKIDQKAHNLFDNALLAPDLLAQVHAGAGDISALAEKLTDLDERNILRTICSQLETSALCLSYGLYHPAMATLRLCLELGLASIYFSSNKLAHREWLANGDLSWSVVNGDDGGVFSPRFIKAFFPELRDHAMKFRERAAATYTALSKYVHGNNHTWGADGLTLSLNDEVRAAYRSHLSAVVDILKFAYCARHLCFMSTDDREQIADSVSDLQHIGPIRERCGGPKEIK